MHWIEIKKHTDKNQYFKDMAIHQQILKDNNGNNVGVFVPFEEYQKILDKLEELQDIRDFDKAKIKNEDTIPLREARKLRMQKNG